MAQGTFAIVASVGGITINQAITTTGNHPNPYQLPLPIAWAGTIASATVTLPDGHAIVSGTVDIYWVAGGSQQCRYGCSATVTVDALPLTGGTGGTLPASAPSRLARWCSLPRRSIPAACSSSWSMPMISAMPFWSNPTAPPFCRSFCRKISPGFGRASPESAIR